jgi:hypothetical protein
MRHGSLSLASLLVIGAAAAHVVKADVSSNPYRQTIVDRNVFGLKSPPPPPPPESFKPPPSKLILVGIVNIFGTKKAVIKSAEPPKPAAPGQPPVADDPYVLTENQSKQGIEVLEIDEKAGSVKVDNNGQPETLTFDKNGAKLPSGPAVPAPGVAPAGAPGGIPRPGFPAGFPMRNGMPGMPTAPGAMGGQGVGAAGVPGTAGIAAGTGVAATDGSIPARPVRTDGTPNTVEQNVLLYEANRLRNEELAKAGLIPRMPTHPLIKRMEVEEANQNMGQATQ